MRYRAWFEFVDTEDQAKEKCIYFDSLLNRYARKKYPAHYTPWINNQEKKFIVWTVRQ